MSQIGKVLLFIGMVFMVLWLVSMRVLAGSYMPFVWVLLGIGLLSLLGALFKDIQFFIELSGQRTTKHGMNLGLMAVIVLAILVGVNYVNFRHVKKIDYTKEGLHSLSDQTKGILNSLDSDLAVNAFFEDSEQSAAAAHQHFKELADLFISQSPHVKVAYFSPIRHVEKAKTLDINAAAQVALEFKGKKAKFEDMTEQGFVNAIIKITRTKNKLVYFVTGHEERDVESAERSEMNQFKKYLTDMSYEVKTLSFIEKQTVPDDADLLVIAGPKQPYFDAEINAVEDYLYKGGHLLLALDPGTKTNLGKLTHDIGVDFENAYILDPYGQIVGGSMAMVMGLEYSRSSDITKGFRPGVPSLFHLASPVAPAHDKPEGITVETIVKSSPKAFTKKDISEGKVKFDSNTDKMQPYGVVCTALGKLKEETGKGAPKEFSAVVAGDSDFLSNQLIDAQPTNHDLALNAASFLAKDKELVNIHPKKSEGNIVTMTDMQKSLMGWTLIGLIPLALAATGGTFMYRRRNV